MSRCTECDARIDPGMECIWFEEPRCSDCCGCDDDEPTTPIPGQVDIFGQETP